jgi:hypothetical protein
LPDAGLDVEVNVLEIFEGVPSSLESRLGYTVSPTVERFFPACGSESRKARAWFQG